MKEKKSKNYSLTYPKIVALGFALIILIGTILLMLPISSRGEEISFIDAFFTATSATCVTGLVTYDTATTWSLFGQIVILCLIQIGGLGFLTVIAFVSGIIKKRMSLKEKMLLKDAVGSLNIGGGKNLVRSVLLLTLCCEVTGAIILSTRFIPLAGVPKGIYLSVFTSISAFCNAGFDLMGSFVPSSSLTTVNNDPVIIITVSLLIIIGGLGFIVWQDMRDKKFNFKNFSIHTKLVLTITSVILVGCTVLFLVFEYANEKTLADMPLWQKLLNAFFANVTTRTAGFNSIDTAGLTSASKMLTIMLMFIGGSSGSTAGGVKTTTVAVLILCVISTLKNKDDVNAFDHRINNTAIKKAISIVFINFAEIVTATFLILLFQKGFTLIDVLFECTSAIGTVGMSTGITPELCTASKLVIIFLMYVGRLTSLIFALMFISLRAKTTTQKPLGNILVG
ncbi:MAG: TrkH family potassium uptake protein [Eubacterium sp.]